MIDQRPWETRGSEMASQAHVYRPKYAGGPYSDLGAPAPWIGDAVMVVEEFVSGHVQGADNLAVGLRFRLSRSGAAASAWYFDWMVLVYERLLTVEA